MRAAMLCGGEEVEGGQVQGGEQITIDTDLSAGLGLSACSQLPTMIPVWHGQLAKPIWLSDDGGVSAMASDDHQPYSAKGPSDSKWGLGAEV